MPRIVERRQPNRDRQIFLAVCITAALAMTILLFFVVRQQRQITNQTRVIQTERTHTIRRECEEQNARHDKALDTLNQILPPSRAAGEGRQFTILMINALQPRQDCQKVVEAAVPSGN